VSPAQIREVGQEYGDFLLDNWGVIAASLSVFSAAMAGALWLGLTPPGIAILLILGKLGLDAYKHELEVMQKHGVKWIELAVHANRNPQLLAEASNEYIRMWASFGKAIASLIGFLGPAKLGASFLARWNLDRLPAPRLTTNQVDAVPVGTVRDPDGTIIPVYEVPASTHGRASTTATTTAATTTAAPPSQLNSARLAQTMERSPGTQPVFAAFGSIPPVVDTLISEPFSAADPWPETVESTPSFSGGFYANRSKMRRPPPDSPTAAQPQHVSALVRERGLPPVPVTATRASAELLNPGAAPRSRESFQSKNAAELANLEPWLKETASRYKGFSRFSCGFASVSHAYALNVDSRGLSLLQLQRINRDYFTKVSAQGVLFDQVPEFEAFLKQIPGVTTQLVIAEYGAVNATIQTPVLRGIRNPEGVNGHWILDLGMVSPTEHLVSSADSHGVVEMKRISVSALKALINVQPEQNRNGPPAILLKFHSTIAPTASRFAPLRSGPNAQPSVPRTSPTPKTRSANKGKDTTDPADVASFSGAPRRVNVDQPTFAEIADLQKVPGLSDADIDLLMRLVEAPMTSQAIEQVTARPLARDVVISINSTLRKAGRGAIVFDGLSHYHLRTPDQVLRMNQARTEVEAQMALAWRTIQTQHGPLQINISQIDVALVERWFAKGVMTKQAIRDHLRLHLPREVIVPEGAEDQLAKRVHRALAKVSFDKGRVTTTVHGGRIEPMEDSYRLEFSAAPSAAKGDWGEVQIGGQPRYLRLKRSDLEWFQTFLDRGFCLTSDVSVAVVDRINTALKNGRESLNGVKTVDLGEIRPSDGPYARKRYEFKDTRSASDGTRTPWPSPGHAGRVRS
jgi:hypothetical protein